MALTQTVTLPGGIIMTDAYIKVTNIQGNKHVITAYINVYADKKHSDSGLESLYSDIVYFVPDLITQDNFIEQAYKYLKNVPIFNDSADC